MSVRALQQKWAKVFGGGTRTGNRQYFLKRLAWRIRPMPRTASPMSPPPLPAYSFHECEPLSGDTSRRPFSGAAGAICRTWKASGLRTLWCSPWPFEQRVVKGGCGPQGAVEHGLLVTPGVRSPV